MQPYQTLVDIHGMRRAQDGSVKKLCLSRAQAHVVTASRQEVCLAILADRHWHACQV